MKKCPCCGYEFGKKYNPSMEIVTLLSRRDMITKNMINQACSYIQSEVPSDDNIKKRFQFIQGISHVDNDSIQYTIARFVSQKLYMQKNTQGKWPVISHGLIQNIQKNL